MQNQNYNYQSRARVEGGIRKGTKRPHRKVRSGCMECKSRKLKCDEGRPTCSLCKRYSVLCIYPPSRTTPAVVGLQHTPNFRQIEVPRDLSHETTDLQVEDLELLHHWTMFACHGFGDKPGDEKPWQIEMTQIACKAPFLMRGILAVSALHMSRFRPEEKTKWLIRAVYHQDLALPSYRYVVDDFKNKMTEQNCHAVIGFASLTSAYAIADPHPQGVNRFAGVSSPTGVPEWLHLLRGARKILDVGRNWIAKGPMAFQVRTIEEPIDLTYNPDDFYLAALEPLFNRRDRSGFLLSEGEMKAYRTSLRLLRESSAMHLLPCQTLGIKLSMFRWVERVPQEYLDLLGELKPEALVLLAHFCVLLKKGGKNYWYMEGAAERLISALYDVLGEEWKSWIAWPLKVVNDSSN